MSQKTDFFTIKSLEAFLKRIKDTPIFNSSQTLIVDAEQLDKLTALYPGAVMYCSVSDVAKVRNHVISSGRINDMAQYGNYGTTRINKDEPLRDYGSLVTILVSMLKKFGPITIKSQDALQTVGVEVMCEHAIDVSTMEDVYHVHLSGESRKVIDIKKFDEVTPECVLHFLADGKPIKIKREMFARLLGKEFELKIDTETDEEYVTVTSTKI